MNKKYRRLWAYNKLIISADKQAHSATLVDSRKEFICHWIKKVENELLFCWLQFNNNFPVFIKYIFDRIFMRFFMNLFGWFSIQIENQLPDDAE